jgi:hypothetical protein
MLDEPAMRDFIDSQIAAKRAALDELERKKLTVQAELRTYEEMRAHLNEEVPHEQKPKGPNGSKLSERIPPAIPHEMTEGWKKILVELGRLGRSFDAADIVKVGDGAGVSIKMLNVRSQLYQWDRKTIITRVRKGRYKLTTKGLALIQKNEGSEASASDPLTP